MKVAAHGAVDAGGGEVVAAFYCVYEVWVTHKTFAALDAYGS